MAVAYYYDHMTKPKQAAYRSMLAGLTELSDSFQLLRICLWKSPFDSKGGKDRD